MCVIPGPGSSPGPGIQLYVVAGNQHEPWIPDQVWIGSPLWKTFGKIILNCN